MLILVKSPIEIGGMWNSLRGEFEIDDVRDFSIHLLDVRSLLVHRIP